jgi:hypothetical protein
MSVTALRHHSTAAQPTYAAAHPTRQQEQQVAIRQPARSMEPAEILDGDGFQ